VTTEPTQHGAALESWNPPTPPGAQRTALTRALIALRPAVMPLAIGAISWTVSVHGGAHSIGDLIAPLAVTAICASVGTIQTVAAAKKAAHRPTVTGESEPHTGLIAVRAGLVAWAVAGLSALAAADIYTTSPWLRVLYTAIGAAAPVVYRRLAADHHNELHLALTQRLQLERTVADAQLTLEQTRQNGASTRTAAAEEHATIRERLRQDGKTTRTGITQQHTTARKVLDTYAAVATGPSTPGATAAGSAPALPEHLQRLLSLSGPAAEALGAESLALLGHAAATAEPIERPEPGVGNYL
jgi:hypothetical protein